MKNLLIVSLFAFAGPVIACPSAPFTAQDGKEAIADLQGDRILDEGWTVYSEGEDEQYSLTRFKREGMEGRSLWLYRAKDYATQPGIIWGVWKDSGMIEGFVNVYEIATNVRGVSRKANLVYDDLTGRTKVLCN